MYMYMLSSNKIHVHAHVSLARTLLHTYIYMEKHVYSPLAIKKRKTPNQTHQVHVHVDIHTTQKHTYTKTCNHTEHTKEAGP